MHPFTRFLKLPPCKLCKMGADEKRTHSPCWGDEVLILVAWLAFGFWHQPLQKVQSTIYKVQREVQSTIYKVQREVQSTIYKVQFALSTYLRCPLFFVLCSLSFVLIHVVFCSLFFVLNFTWGLPCQKEDDEVCSQSSGRCQRHCQHRLKIKR